MWHLKLFVSTALVLLKFVDSQYVQYTTGEVPQMSPEHEKKREEWNMCSSVCRQASGQRMILSPQFGLECRGGSNGDGTLRVIDAYSPEILGYQACSYGSGMGSSPVPLRIRRKGLYHVNSKWRCAMSLMCSCTIIVLLQRQLSYSLRYCRC
eukprot:TRINITY_DN9869_c0_g1_i1.p1 TRINITY_DN9869_c0_g1~~TRINITY_DN9869_c0_g1_i1.p1  ORF type:complete len:152 (-),score=6.81 TRINITY_DN9869_c0_g1_i1:64-519(-)